MKKIILYAITYTLKNEDPATAICDDYDTAYEFYEDKKLDNDVDFVMFETFEKYVPNFDIISIIEEIK